FSVFLFYLLVFLLFHRLLLFTDTVITCNVIPTLKDIFFIRLLKRIIVMEYICHSVVISLVRDNPVAVLIFIAVEVDYSKVFILFCLDRSTACTREVIAAEPDNASGCGQQEQNDSKYDDLF